MINTVLRKLQEREGSFHFSEFFSVPSHTEVGVTTALDRRPWISCIKSTRRSSPTTAFGQIHHTLSMLISILAIVITVSTLTPLFDNATNPNVSLFTLTADYSFPAIVTASAASSIDGVAIGIGEEGYTDGPSVAEEYISCKDNRGIAKDKRHKGVVYLNRTRRLPLLDVCTVEDGCPQSAMAWASGTFMESGDISEAVLQRADNLTLHLHLCCDYRFRSEILTDNKLYVRFLQEMLHGSHFFARQQFTPAQMLKMFPHELIFLTNSLLKRLITPNSVRKSAQKSEGKSVESSVDSDYNNNTFSSHDLITPEDGDILTIIYRGQGDEFSINLDHYSPQGADDDSLERSPSNIKCHGINCNKEMGDESAADDEEASIIHSGLLQSVAGGLPYANADNNALLSHMHRKLQVSDLNRKLNRNRDDTSMDIQLFIPNFILKCKCPHTLHVLPLLRYKEDVLPPLALDGLGARCVTNDRNTKPHGPWERLIIHRRGGITRGISTEKGMSSYDYKSHLEDINKCQNADEGVESVATTFFSIIPMNLPLYTKVEWKLYILSDKMEKEIYETGKSRKTYGRSDLMAPLHASGGQNIQHRQHGNHHQTKLDKNNRNDDKIFTPISLSELQRQNLWLQHRGEPLSVLMARVEEEAISEGGSSYITLVNQSTDTILIKESEEEINKKQHFDDAEKHKYWRRSRGVSDRFDIIPNQKYLISAVVTRGKAKQTLRGLFVLRMPAWLSHPNLFLVDKTTGHPINPSRSTIQLEHRHLLLGRHLGGRKLRGLSRLTNEVVGEAANKDEEWDEATQLLQSRGGFFKRIYAPMVNVVSHRKRCESCLNKFRLLLSQRHADVRKERNVLTHHERDKDAIAEYLDKSEGYEHLETQGHNFQHDIRTSLHDTQIKRRDEREKAIHHQASLRHEQALQDKGCHDVFTILNQQLQMGQELHLPESLLKHPTSGTTEKGKQEVLMTGRHRPNDYTTTPLLPQHVHLRDPQNPLFRYDEMDYINDEVLRDHFLLDHLISEASSVPGTGYEENAPFDMQYNPITVASLAQYPFPLGVTNVSVWLQDVDGVCNATKAEVAEVHSLHAMITRPSIKGEVLCSKDLIMEALDVKKYVDNIRAAFPGVLGALNGFTANKGDDNKPVSGIDVSWKWSCYNQSGWIEDHSDDYTAAYDVETADVQRDKRVGRALKDNSPNYDIHINGARQFTASANLTSKVTARCFFNIFIKNIPQSANESAVNAAVGATVQKFLHFDDTQVTVIREGSYFNPSFDVQLEDDTTVHSRSAEDIPLQLDMTINTKEQIFYLGIDSGFHGGIPTDGTWVIDQDSPVRFVEWVSDKTLLPSDAHQRLSYGGKPIHHNLAAKFELRPNAIFSDAAIAEDRVGASAFGITKTASKYIITRNDTDGTASILLPRSTITYKVSPDESGTCPDLDVVVLVKLVQSPPEQPFPVVSEHFIEDSYIILEAPRDVREEDVYWEFTDMHNISQDFYLDSCNLKTLELMQNEVKVTGQGPIKGQRLQSWYSYFKMLYLTSEESNNVHDKKRKGIAEDDLSEQQYCQKLLSAARVESLYFDQHRPSGDSEEKLFEKLRERYFQDKVIKRRGENQRMTAYDSEESAILQINGQEIRTIHRRCSEVLDENTIRGERSAVRQIGITVYRRANEFKVDKNRKWLRIDGIEEGSTFGIRWRSSNTAGEVHKTHVIHRCRFPPSVTYYNDIPKIILVPSPDSSATRSAVASLIELAENTQLHSTSSGNIQLAYDEANKIIPKIVVAGDVDLYPIAGNDVTLYYRLTERSKSSNQESSKMYSQKILSSHDRRLYSGHEAAYHDYTMYPISQENINQIVVAMREATSQGDETLMFTSLPLQVRSNLIPLEEAFQSNYTVSFAMDSHRRFPYLLNATPVEAIDSHRVRHLTLELMKGNPLKAASVFKQPARRDRREIGGVSNESLVNVVDSLFTKGGEEMIETRSQFETIHIGPPLSFLQVLGLESTSKYVLTAAVEVDSTKNKIRMSDNDEPQEVQSETHKCASEYSLKEQIGIRVYNEFQRRKLCKSSKRKFSLYSIDSRSLVGLLDGIGGVKVHDYTEDTELKIIKEQHNKYEDLSEKERVQRRRADERKEESLTEKQKKHPITLTICAGIFRFLVKPELHSWLGYDFTWNCPSAFTVEKNSPTDTKIIPLQVGASEAKCVLTTYNSVSNTTDAAEINVKSVVPTTGDSYEIYVLDDVREYLTQLSPEELKQKMEFIKKHKGRMGKTSESPENNRNNRRRSRIPSRLVDDSSDYKNKNENGKAGNDPYLVVGRSTDLVIYSPLVRPYSGVWYVTTPTIPMNWSTEGKYMSSAKLRQSVVIREISDKQFGDDYTHTGSSTGGSQVIASVTNIIAPGIYTIAYEQTDPRSGPVCPNLMVQTQIFVFQAEVLRQEIITCQQEVTLESVPVHSRFLGAHYGRWTVVSYHISPAGVAVGNPNDLLYIEHPTRARTIIRGLDFGIVRVRWGIYRNSTGELLDSTMVTIKVLADSISPYHPSGRMVTFKDQAEIYITSSMQDWDIFYGDPASLEREAVDTEKRGKNKGQKDDRMLQRYTRRHGHRQLYYEKVRVPKDIDPKGALSGKLHVENLDIGTTILHYRSVESSRLHTFPALANLKCPSDQPRSYFEVERVSASIFAATNMKVECDIYNGQGVITLFLETGGSEDIKFVTESLTLQQLIFDGSDYLRKRHKDCEAPWWARRDRARWMNVSFFNKNRSVNITVMASEYLDSVEVGEYPLFSTHGSDCHEAGAFLSSQVIDGVPHEFSTNIFVPIKDRHTLRLSNKLNLRPIRGEVTKNMAPQMLGEEQITIGNASIDISLGLGAAFSRYSPTSLLQRCLKGQLTLEEFATPWRMMKSNGIKANVAWERYLKEMGSYKCRCKPLLMLPHSISSTPSTSRDLHEQSTIANLMTLEKLEEQLDIIHHKNFRILHTKDGIDITGLQRATQLALARRRITRQQLMEVVARNRIIEADRLSRLHINRQNKKISIKKTKNDTFDPMESDKEYFDRIINLASSVFGHDPLVTAIRVFLPASPGFYTTEDIGLEIKVSKKVICGTKGLKVTEMKEEEEMDEKIYDEMDDVEDDERERTRRIQENLPEENEEEKEARLKYQKRLMSENELERQRRYDEEDSDEEILRRRRYRLEGIPMPTQEEQRISRREKEKRRREEERRTDDRLKQRVKRMERRKTRDVESDPFQTLATCADFGEAVIVDESVRQEVYPASIAQCQLENDVPTLNFAVVNSAFRSDASTETCPMILIDDGVVYGDESEDEWLLHNDTESRTQRNQRKASQRSISSDELELNPSLGSPDGVGLHACFRSLRKMYTFNLDPSSHKSLQVQLSSCPYLSMLAADEYNSFESGKRSLVASERTARPHRLRFILKNCLIPDKYEAHQRSRNLYSDITFSILVNPTVAHLKLLSSPMADEAPIKPQRGSSVTDQYVDARLREADSLVLCEWDMKARGISLGVLLSGDKWHPRVGVSTTHGRGSHNVALLNSFSVVERDDMNDAASGVLRSRQREYIVKTATQRAEESMSGRHEYTLRSSSTPHYRASKFLRYLFTELQTENRKCQKQDNMQLGTDLDNEPMYSDCVYNTDGQKMQQLVRRFNDTFISILLPKMQISRDKEDYTLYTSTMGDQNRVGGVIGHQQPINHRRDMTGEEYNVIDSLETQLHRDPSLWGFGGSIEEIRMAIPGVTTECNGCLLSDINFFVAGDFSGSLSMHSQRSVSKRDMAERAQLYGDERHYMRLSLSQLRPVMNASLSHVSDHSTAHYSHNMFLYHHWICPVTAATRLQELLDQLNRRGTSTSHYEDGYRDQGKNEIRHLLASSVASSGDGTNVPTIRVTIEIPLGVDSDFAEDFSEENSEKGKESIPCDNTCDNSRRDIRTSEKSHIVLSDVTTIHKDNYTDQVSMESKRQTVVIIHSASTGISTHRIIQEAEVSFQITSKALERAYNVISRAMKRRRRRTGGGKDPRTGDDVVSFNGIARVHTCLGSLPKSPCIETTYRPVKLGDWGDVFEEEVSDGLGKSGRSDPNHMRDAQYEYIATGQRLMQQAFRNAKGSLTSTSMLFLILHHILTAWLLVLLFRVATGSAAINNAPALSQLMGSVYRDQLGMRGGYLATGTSSNVSSSRHDHSTISDVVGSGRPRSSNVFVAVGAFLLAAYLCYYHPGLWCLGWLGLWVFTFFVNNNAKGASALGFILHILLFVVAIKKSSV